MIAILKAKTITILKFNQQDNGDRAGLQIGITKWSGKIIYTQ
jgi:hypothetical protein